ncbi:MAG: carboxypeptidase-like regulatory domain-containing protein [Gemmatimonadaceae bacterium]|nr:carboxypeptidase-like regulatory domain-containing protein [Gemmatimonadaceae bacterium]
MLALAIALWAAPMFAQRTPAGFGRIAGVVVDTTGNPMANATVLLLGERRQVRTRDDGTFLLDSVKTGAVRITARAIGYVSVGIDLFVRADSTSSTRLELLQFAVVLPAMTSVASELGLSGIVGDTTYRAILGAKVQVLGTGLVAFTDSLGQFRLPLKPGSYMVRIEAKGFRGQAVGVSIAPDAGRKITALLPEMRRMDAIEIMRQWNLGNLHERLLVASAVYNKVFTRDDLRRLGIDDPVRILAQLTAQPLDPDVCVKINGGPAWAPLWSIPIDDIEFLEANIARPARNTRTSLNGMTPRGNGGSGMTCPYIAWLRQ